MSTLIEPDKHISVLTKIRKASLPKIKYSRPVQADSERHSIRRKERGRRAKECHFSVVAIYRLIKIRKTSKISDRSVKPMKIIGGKS